MGRDKALIERPDGARQLDHIIALARSISTDILISTNSPDIVPTGIPILPDLNPGDGPLGALASFHHAHPDEAVLLIGCDLFLLDKATIDKLISAHTQAHSSTCFKSRIDSRPEPLCAIYESSALAMASGALANNEFCARHFLESLDPHTLELLNPVALDNANTPADLEEAFTKITDGVSSKSVKVLYFAKLREERGVDEESVETLACTAAGLYDELSFRHRLSLKLDSLRCARNGDFCDWNTRIEANDEIVFIPPVAGG
jgi:molybdopterin-guanine dinucleotide biosynthesis protein A